MATFYQNSDLYYQYRVKVNSGVYSEDDIVEIEFTLDAVQKKFPSESVEKVADGVYSIRFTQEDTINLPEGVVLTQARVRFKSGSVVPTNTVYVDVKRTLSKNILGGA